MTEQQQRMDMLHVAGLLAVAAALLFLGVISVANHLSWQEPTDGVDWELRGGRVVAAVVEPEGPGASAGVREGDVLRAIEGQPPIDPTVVEVLLFNRDVGQVLDIEIEREGRGQPLILVIGGETVRETTYYYLAFIGLAFLVVGVFALLRQPDPSSRRFFLLALTFYALFALSPTTRESDPWHHTIYWLDQLARDLAPAMFLYFALSFPRPKPELGDSRRAVLAVIFAPAFALAALNLMLVYGGGMLGLTPGGADRVFQLGARAELIYFALSVALGVLVLAHTYKTADTPLRRMRMKWLVGGIALGALPFVVLYVPMQVLGLRSWPLTNLAVLPLIFVPLSFAYAVVGFRLWDVEVILKRTLIYAVSSLVILAVYMGSQWTLARILGPDDNLVQTASLLATLLAAIAFAPLRDKLQDLADRVYYRERYRARRTLTDFARELNSETDLARLVDLLVGRVRETLGVGRVAVLLRIEEHDHLRIVPASGSLSDGGSLSSNFSQFVAGALSRREMLFVDDLRSLLEEFPDDQEVLESEDLAYFLPLEVKGDIIGVLAIGRKLSGDYLSTDDLKVLQPLAAHVALAIDNALLYREAQHRAAELEQLKTYSENIVESITGGVMVLDPEGRVAGWNRSLEAIHELPAHEAIGRQVAEVFPERFIDVLNEARDTVRRGHEPMTSAYRIPLRNRGGHDRVVTLSVAPLLGDERGQGGVVVIVDDVTERTELESQLRQAEKLTSVGLLAAGVAHEVNTPLAGISSYVQMLQRKLPETDPRRAILEKIEKQTFRASQIVNNLLNFSRQETGEFRPVDVNEVVRETLALAEIQLRKRKVMIETTLAEELQSVLGDPIKLQQVLMNLVLNARDAMPQGGDLRIVTRQSGSDVLIEVSDNGTGIAQEHLGKVYDPFFTTKGVGKGTGLGLSVSYGIVQEHRGSISVNSQPGKGTTFRLALPGVDAAAAHAAAG